jgi:CrcB protein
VTALVWVSVGLLGGIGALGRFLLDAAVSLRLGRQFPVGTLVVNLSGAFLLGLLVGLGVGGRALLLAGTATLGSYTTFSTWMLESHRLGEDGEVRLALANLAVSLLAGVAAAAVGRALGGAL